MSKSAGVLLDGKSAVLYGAGGTIGTAVACAFARDGARLFLAGRTAAPIQVLAKKVGSAEFEIVDATDFHAVEQHFASALERAGNGSV